MDKNGQVVEIDVWKLLRAILRHFWIVLLAIIVFGAAGYSYARFYVTPTYTANVLMYVNNSSVTVGSTSLSISGSDLSTSEKLVATYNVILNTRYTLEEVIAKTGVNRSCNELSKMITSGSVDGTGVFSVAVTSSDPAEAAAIANAISNVLPYKIESVINGSSAKVVDAAVVPTVKDGPNITKYAMIGALLGALVSCAIIALFDIMDDGIHDDSYITENFDLPILGVIPELTQTGKRSYSKYGYKKYGYKKYGYGYNRANNEAFKNFGKKNNSDNLSDFTESPKISDNNKTRGGKV